MTFYEGRSFEGGSVTGLTQTVVRTTRSGKGKERRRTTSIKLSVQPLPHNFLVQPQTRTHNHPTSERESSRPSRASNFCRDTAGTAMPDGNGCDHGKEGLEECTAEGREVLRLLT